MSKVAAPPPGALIVNGEFPDLTNTEAAEVTRRSDESAKLSTGVLKTTAPAFTNILARFAMLIAPVGAARLDVKITCPAGPARNRAAPPKVRAVFPVTLRIGAGPVV